MTKIIDISTTHDIISSAPNRDLESAILIMGNRKFRRLPITKLGKIRGIITLPDMFHVFVDVGLPDALSEKISDWMNPNPITIHPDAEPYDAIKLMVENDVGSLLVMSERNDVLRGIVTERDFLLHFRDEVILHKNLAELPQEILHYEYTRIDVTTPIVNTIKHMDSVHCEHILVEESGDNVVGIISANDLTSLFSKELGNIKNDKNYLNTRFAREIMSDRLISIEIDADIENVLDIMCKNHIGSIPLTRNGNVIGMFTERTYLKLLYDHFTGKI